MRHATLQSIADRLAEVGIATFRYNFPYSENGKGRDWQAVCTATVRSAVAAARRGRPGLPLLAGGHSFSGRMTSTAASESPLEGVRGLVFFSFPLHLAGKPETKRADHLAAVTVPMLFLSGTRDELAELDLLRPVCEKLGEPRDAPPPGHGRPRLQDPQEVPHERRGRLRRDGSRRAGLGSQTGEQEARMKIATYNVNSINARLPVLLHWLAQSKPDVACLQELKATDEKFPVDAIREAGYEAVWHGQKAWNGVAILARGEKPEETRRGLPGDPDDTHSRYIEAVVGGVTVGCLYLPNGNPAPGPKFDYKLKWFERLNAHAAGLLEKGGPVVLAGDYNVIPTERDVYKPERWVDDALFLPETREAYRELLAQGWTDALRHLHPDETIYTFWDYMRGAFSRNAGLRIDHLLLSPELAPRLKAAGVDRDVRAMEKTSDHAPTWIELG